MDTGTVTELTPQDGLGWITLDDGRKIRFGGTACAGSVPTVGMRVRVLGTAPGYRGVVKATRIEPLVPLAPPPAPAAPASRPRADLARLDALGPTFDAPLRAILARADADDAVYADLERLAFELAPMRAEELDVRDPAFFVVAMDGGGNAFGRYAAPGVPGLPWVFWDHEEDAFGHVADDTPMFFATLLASWRGKHAPEAAARLKTVLASLGVALPAVAAGAPAEGIPAVWLPSTRSTPKGR